MKSTRSVAALFLAAALGVAACGGDDDDGDASAAAEPAAQSADQSGGDDAAASGDAAGIRVVTPQDAAATIADPPDDLVILDVRTPEEYAEGHVDGAVLLDFYREDFAEQLAELDPDVSYVLYCRSGNRSGQTRTLMSDLGFTDVADVEGGIVNWQSAGLPVVTD